MSLSYFQGDASVELGALSYRNSLSGDVRVDGSDAVWDSRFSASAGYGKIIRGTGRLRRFYTSARAKCVQYELVVNYLNAAVNVTPDFKRSVDALPLAPDDLAYDAFIDAYGTHFTSRVTMGARMVVSSMQIAGLGTRGSGTCGTGTAVLGHAELGQQFWDMRNWDSGSGTCGTGTVFIV